MSYATQQDLIDRFGAPELVDLTNRGEESTGEVDGTMVAAALDEADAEINSYLARRMTTPVAPVPGQVKRIATDIARYRLFKDNPPDHVVRLYRDAVAWLVRAGNGEVSLGDGMNPTAPASGGAPMVDTPGRTFSPETLGGF